jgi:hypothetical protein
VVNDGLSRNLRKPPETSGNLRKPPETSGNLPKPPETSGNLPLETSLWKPPSGNLPPETYLRKPPETFENLWKPIVKQRVKNSTIPGNLYYLVRFKIILFQGLY